MTKTTNVSDELEKYLAAPLEQVEDPLAWWIKNRHLYPRLSRMALDYLSIPGEFRLEHPGFYLD